MKQLHCEDKYPMTVMEIAKSDTTHQSLASIADYYRNCIVKTPAASYIGTFDHFGHTLATNVLFCFGVTSPSPQVLAVCPRSIGIADLGDHFLISFMNADPDPCNHAMQAWTIALRNK